MIYSSSNPVTDPVVTTMTTILIVDDSEADRATYRRYLHVDDHHPVTILEAQTLEEAVALWRSQQPNLALVKGRLPDGDGLTFLAVMAEGLSEQNVPLILLVERDDEPLALQAMQRGAMDYLFKQELSPTLLSCCIRSVLEHQALTRSPQPKSPQPKSPQPKLPQPKSPQSLLPDPWNPEQSLPAIPANLLSPDELDPPAISRSPAHPPVTNHKETTSPFLTELAGDPRDFLDPVSDLIHLVSPEGQILYGNPAWKRVLGYNEAELKHLSLFALMPPDSHAAYRTLINAASSDRPTVATTLTLLTKAGKALTLEGTVNFHYQQGQLLYLQGIFRDTNGHQQIEAKLAKSEALFQLLVEGAKDLIWSCDLEGIFTYLSPQYEVLLGWKTADWVGQSVVLLVHPEDLPVVYDFVEKMLTVENPSESLECRLLHKDGHYVWIHCNETPMRDADGVPIGFQGIMRDISDRKLAEQQLAEKNIILHSVMDGTPDLIYIKDLQGQYVTANAAFGQFVGKASNDILGARDSELFSPHLVQAIQKSDQKIMTTGEMETLEEDVQMGETLTTFWTTKFPWRNAQGEIQGVIGIARDISDRKQAEAQLQKTNEWLSLSNHELAHATRLKDEFLANMSHELRTPLNAILGMSECLQDGIFAPLNPQQKDAMATIQQGGHHLLDLINDILDLAKIEAGKFELQPELIPVKSLCENSLLFVRELAYKKQIQLTLRIVSAPVQILVDQRRMMQVLLNLLTNAVKFTPERGKVSLIVAQETETALIFSVIDTGIGIAPDHFTEIFQPFLQIDSRLNRQQMGTGLGLSLVKRLMDLQGGTVSVTSEVGVGSCFRLEFPLEPSLLSDPGKKSFPLISNLSSDSALSLPLILLVDNHRPNVRSVSSYLTAKGFRIRVAANAQEAIALAQIDRPDLILLDMPLSEKEGLTILGQMSGDRQFSQIPIIALIDPALSRDRYLTAGAKDALAKPLKLRLLTRIIEQNLGIRSLA